MIAALVPYLFPLGAAFALATMASTMRAYLPLIRTTMRDAMEG